jgi:hypothetical protein
MLKPAATVALAAGIALATGCRHEDPGFEIVRVPRSAYVMPDAGKTDASPSHDSDAGVGPLIVCVPRGKAATEDDEQEDSDECPPHWDGRNYDPRVTTRHHDRGENDVCCYRRGRLPAGDN